MNEAIVIEAIQKTPPKKYLPPVAYPVNCSHPCCYGHGHPFCFPCMKKILEEHRKNRKEQ